ncbi:exocyst complex component exo84 [Cladophialophora chaetospira]|uniref:Exocyst complex component EXO84 n=1 Tax=Cladophialophora chaetospira TaxID=386627 RepID=A0AA38XH00_9EURO|nr:exocyst complex component exo84 [Cladophialophora chaetospira]
MDTRGLTLRKKRKDRPIISAPKNATGPGIGGGGRASLPSQSKAGNTLNVPRDRNAPTETSDLVKRRYSTRYNQLPDFRNIDTPAVPALPGAGTLKRRSGGGSPRRPGTGDRSRPLLVDNDILKDPNLHHEKYVTDLLANASEQDIQEYQNGLQKLKDRNSQELLRNVYQNRTQFIKISKEAEKLKSEMSMLQNLMSELTGTLGAGDAGGTSSPLTPELSGPSLSRRNTNRSSVANLEQMWNIQLQTLWKNIEKSQKFLPAAPGRHIVAETPNWIELDSATWKPKRPVHIVLLNDHVLVASKKRKRVDPNAPQQGPAPTKLVAEECWPLQDIEIIDMAANVVNGAASHPAEEKAIASALTIRSGGRSLTYRHEKRDEKAKAGLLSALRKAAEDLRKATKTEEEQSKPQAEPMNYFAARDPASAKNTEIIESINASKEKPDILIEVDGRQQNFRWVEGQIDDLDIEISMQRFDEAVEKVEKLRKIAKTLKGNSVAQELVSVKIDERAAKLASILCRELVETPSFVEATKRKVSYLIRLGFEDRARDAYLNARSDVLAKRARQCVFEGDLHRYVFSISYVYFTVVKNTVLIYQAAFTSPGAISACIKWAGVHLETFNTLLVRQLSAIEREGKLWRECMDVVWAHEKEMLGNFGLDFREVIGRGLEVKEIIGRHERSNAGGNREQSRSKSRVRAGT